MSKAVYAFLCDPVAFSGSTAFLFDDTEKGGYRHVFGDGKDVWEFMPTEEFRLRSAIWWLASAVGDRLQRDRAEATDVVKKAAQERKWWFIFAVRLVLEAEFGAQLKERLAPHYKGEWVMGEKAVGQWFEAIYRRAHSAVVFAYQQAYKTDGFVHRNWMRNTRSIQEVREAVETVGQVAGPFRDCRE